MPLLGPGSPFPRLGLLDANGRPAALPSGDTLYAFFKTSCPTCELAWPFLERLREAAQGGPLSIVAVSQDNMAQTAAFHERLGVRLETVYDPPPWNVSQALGLANVPTLFAVNPDGRIRETIVGFQKRTLEELASRAAALPAGRAAASLFRPDEKVPEARPG